MPCTQTRLSHQSGGHRDQNSTSPRSKLYFTESNSREMSSAPSQTPLQSLQCHFTWDLDRTRSVLFLIRDKLEDTGSEEGNRWLGHIYNLWGFIQYKLGLHEDAQRLFTQAAEAFHRVRPADQGPWLVVNYGNLAWLHHHLGDQAESQAYLSKVDALMEEYPSLSQDQLHAEVYAEKAWTLMYCRGDFTLAADLFQRAAGMQPDMVEWNTSYVLSLEEAHEDRETGVTPDLLEKMRQAKDQDPENLYLAVLYMEQRAKRGERIEEEAREFAKENLETLSCNYQALRALLRIYRYNLSVDEAIGLAEEALRKHPDQRYLKCAAVCYRWKILFFHEGPTSPEMKNRAISLHEDLVSLYPDSPVKMKTDLAMVYARSGLHQAKAEQIFEELLHTDLEPADKQLLYHAYAKCLHYDLGKPQRSVQFHMKAAEIPVRSYFRERSIKFLERIRDKGRMSREIDEFLENLHQPRAEDEDG